MKAVLHLLLVIITSFLINFTSCATVSLQKRCYNSDREDTIQTKCSECETQIIDFLQEGQGDIWNYSDKPHEKC